MRLCTHSVQECGRRMNLRGLEYGPLLRKHVTHQHMCACVCEYMDVCRTLTHTYFYLKCREIKCVCECLCTRGRVNGKDEREALAVSLLLCAPVFVVIICAVRPQRYAIAVHILWHQFEWECANSIKTLHIARETEREKEHKKRKMSECNN